MAAVEDLAGAPVVELLWWRTPGELPVWSGETEMLWLPTLGPASVCLLRHAARVLAIEPDGVVVPAAELGSALSLGGVGLNSPLVRTMHRLARFGVAQLVDVDGGWRLAVREHLDRPRRLSRVQRQAAS